MTRIPLLGYSTVLLALIALTACQDAPTAPGSSSRMEPAAKPNCDVDPSHASCKDDGGGGGDDGLPNYGIEISGFVSGSGETTTETSGVVARGYTLDLTSLQEAVTDGGICFAHGEYTGSMSVRQQKDGSIEMSFFFGASTTEGGSVYYHFHMDGDVIASGSWLPDANGTEIDFDSWSVEHDSGGPKKSSCSGGGSDHVDTFVQELP